jgi:hypothetical protein
MAVSSTSVLNWLVQTGAVGTPSFSTVIACLISAGVHELQWPTAITIPWPFARTISQVSGASEP